MDSGTAIDLRTLADEDLCFTVDGLFTADECRAWIERGEALGFGEAPINTGRGEVRNANIRNNDRTLVDDPEAAAALFERLRPVLPPTTWMYSQDLPLTGLNERLRFYRYDPGQRFALHRDGHFTRPDRSERSRLSLLVYLNEDFEGGETLFFSSPGYGSHASGGWQETDRAVPKTGRVLVFPHPMFHEGAAVTAGRKYVLRTDVMYAMPPPK
ncbi:uncharacterized iron-regulated protein [Plesiocystis pacifica SIR-1]|uniref:Uncharacterized iron-regulated protein n=1 Tax=Plesiocystis pacifica SIR-1 TaxID=391625 RepID=A6G260_9BACT|nr:2OG-Fe(II) oxygenase [Plesiocystis pacifica]EDM80029.1 uncharacterized iron-regulated protein [Plesiocystis pacifica SIR-1]